MTLSPLAARDSMTVFYRIEHETRYVYALQRGHVAARRLSAAARAAASARARAPADVDAGAGAPRASRSTTSATPSVSSRSCVRTSSCWSSSRSVVEVRDRRRSTRRSRRAARAWEEACARDRSCRRGGAMPPDGRRSSRMPSPYVPLAPELEAFARDVVSRRARPLLAARSI